MNHSSKEYDRQWYAIKEFVIALAKDGQEGHWSMMVWCILMDVVAVCKLAATWEELGEPFHSSSQFRQRYLQISLEDAPWMAGPITLPDPRRN